jgi:hypothetical protein
MRMKGLQLEANGRPVTTDAYGVWNFRSDIGDPLTLWSPTMTFQPASIALADAPMVFAVAVGEKTQKQLASKVDLRLEDENGVPFIGRTLHVELADGRQQTVVVDSDGLVSVPPGSRVSARDDQFGSAIPATSVG